MNRIGKCKKLVVASAFLAITSLALVSFAETTEEAEGEVEEELVVVGTAIRGGPVDAPHAVRVMDRESLETRGMPLMVDLFKQLGASNGVVGERSGWYNTSLPAAVLESVSNVNLRGLGASRSLVLFNGSRQTYLPGRLIGGRFVDVGVLPSIALGRIEVLKEGASAIYGSDAVGGIVNFVTRRDFDGLELAFSHDSFDSASDTAASAIWGGAMGPSSFVVSVEYESRGELESEDRDWALRPLLDPWRAAWSSVGNPGYFWFPEGIDTLTTPRAEVIDALKSVQWSGKVDPRCNELNGYPEHPAVDPFYCVFNYQPFDNLIEKIDYARIFSELNGELGQGVNYHLEMLWSNAIMPRWQTQPSHPPFPLLHLGVMEISPNHPNRMAFCADEDYSQDFRAECASGENWYWRGRPFGNGDPARVARRETSTWRIAGNIEGEFENPWERETFYDLGVSYSRATGNVAIPAILTERLFLAFRGYGGPECGVGVVADNTLGPGMRVAATSKAPGTAGCQYYNPFSSASQFSALPGAPYYDTPNPDFDPSQTNSLELFEWMNSVSNLDSETSLLVLDSTFSGSWLKDVWGYAVGYQFRRFSARGTPNPHGDLSINPCATLGDTNCLSGNFGAFTFINAYNPYDEVQGVHRVFGEIAFHLSDRLDMHFATNFEKYDQASSIDPKFALSWLLHETVTLRASVQTTFRTPSVDDLLEEVPLTATQYISQVGAWIPVDIYGNESLEPEQAFTYNFGMMASLESGIEMTIDFWSYEFNDVIGSLPHNTVDDLYASSATRENVLHNIYCADGRADTLSQPCDPRSITRVEVPLVNWPGVSTSGIDWETSGSFLFRGGFLDAGFNGTYTLNYDIKELYLDGVLIQDFVEAGGKLNFGNPLVVPIPNWKSHLFLAYHAENFVFAGYLNHVSSYKDDGAHDGYGGVPVSNFTIDSFTTLDLSFGTTLERFGLSLMLFALNITDEDPPFANTEHAYDGMTHNPKGRRIKLVLNYGAGVR